MSNQWFEKQVRIYVARCRNSPTAEAIIHLLKDYESRADQLTTKDRQIADLQRLCERAHFVIHDNFKKLCNEDGYGPLSLMDDLWKASQGGEHRELQTLNDELGRVLRDTLSELHDLVETYSHWFKKDSLHGNCKQCGLPEDHKIHL